MRRVLLSLGVLGMGFLFVRRVHANDPSTVEVGGSFSEHDAHVTCGPDVRVRHASAGARVHKVFGEGSGFVIDARGGGGSTAVTKIYDEEPAPSGQPPNGVASTRWVGAGQLALGYSWRPFGFAVGYGYYGFTEGAYAADSSNKGALPLPVVMFRFGRGTPFKGEVGLGAPPIAGLARHYTAYADFELKADESLGIGFGSYSSLLGDLERRVGLYGRGVYTLTPAANLGAFLSLESTWNHDRRIGYAAGLSVTFLLDARPE